MLVPPGAHLPADERKSVMQVWGWQQVSLEAAQGLLQPGTIAVVPLTHSPLLVLADSAISTGVHSVQLLCSLVRLDRHCRELQSAHFV